MVWYDSPSVQTPTDSLGYCYCELLLAAEDLMLQGWLPYPIGPVWVFKVEAYDSAGATLLGDITTSFEYYCARDNHNNPYFNAKMVNYPSILCSQCFILHVTIKYGNTSAFDQWTDLYCIGSCCQIATGITIKDASNNPISYTSDPFPTIEPSINAKCFKQIVRIEGIYDCEDFFGGNYYGDPSIVDSGDASGPFTFRKITNIQATFQRGKREITKEISYNCHTQKVTSVKNYELQSFEVFPQWKVEELEDVLCAPYIKIDGEAYLYYGGDDPFTIINPKSCNYQYKFRATFKDCAIWQIFGCTSKCSFGYARYFGFQNQENHYYDENARLIGNSIGEVESYLAAQNGTFNVEEITPTAKSVYASYYKILKVESSGIIPSYIYNGHVGIDAKVYGKELDENNPDYNSLFNVSSCNQPIIGTVTFADFVCANPVLGTVTFVDSITYSDRVYSYHNWIVSAGGNICQRNGNQVILTFTTSNDNIFSSTENPALVGDIVGYVLDNFAPSQQRILTSDNNPTIPVGATVTIDPNGAISYYGPVDATGVATKSFSELLYII